jgi:hypothetical protein
VLPGESGAQHRLPFALRSLTGDCAENGAGLAGRWTSKPALEIGDRPRGPASDRETHGPGVLAQGVAGGIRKPRVEDQIMAEELDQGFHV